MNEDMRDETKLSFNHFLIKITSMAMLHTPEVNASWEEDQIYSYNSTDIGIAVAIDNGLITPIIRNVENKGLLKISTEISDLISRAREKSIPSEYQGEQFQFQTLAHMALRVSHPS